VPLDRCALGFWLAFAGSICDTPGRAFSFWRGNHSEEFLHRSIRLTCSDVRLAAHTFFDGIAIASGFAFSSALGWLIFLEWCCTTSEGLLSASVMLATVASARIAVSAACVLVPLPLPAVAAIHFLSIAGRHRPASCPPVDVRCMVAGPSAGDAAAADLAPVIAQNRPYALEVNSAPCEKIQPIAIILLMAHSLLRLLTL